MHEVLDQGLPFRLVLRSEFPAVTLHALGTGIFQDDPESGKFCQQHLSRLRLLPPYREVTKALFQVASDCHHSPANESRLFRRRPRGFTLGALFGGTQNLLHSVQGSVKHFSYRRQPSCVKFIESHTFLCLLPCRLLLHGIACPGHSGSSNCRYESA